MTTKRSPSNSDILAALELYKSEDNYWKKETDKRLKSIEKHAEYTNGKVAGLLEDQVRRDEREKMAAELAHQGSGGTSIKADTVVMQQKWFQNERLVGAVVAVLLGIASVFSYIVGVSQ